MWISDVNASEHSTLRSGRPSAPTAQPQAWTPPLRWDEVRETKTPPRWDEVGLLSCFPRQGGMKRHCGDFRSDARGRVNEMVGNEEFCQDLSPLDRMSVVVI